MRRLAQIVAGIALPLSSLAAQRIPGSAARTTPRTSVELTAANHALIAKPKPFVPVSAAVGNAAEKRYGERR
jgi:hypothetical protein